MAFVNLELLGREDSTVEPYHLVTAKGSTFIPTVMGKEAEEAEVAQVRF